MELHNFDAQFQKYLERWMKENSGKFENADQMEAQMPDVYLRWLNTPAKWLGGATPGTAFSGQGDARELVARMQAYLEKNIPVPDPLMERIAAMQEGACAPLMEMACRQALSSEARVMALNLLKEIEVSPEQAPIILSLLLDESAPADVRDVAAELLSAMGGGVAQPALDAMEGASPAAQERLLEVLCNFPGLSGIYIYARDLFLKNPGKRALYASYLGKLGDVRAIPVLEQALSSQELNYLDYIEIVSAIEALGGEVEPTREFYGDPYYESMKRMDSRESS